MYFVPLWRSGEAEPSPANVTQAGVAALEQTGVTDVTQAGVAALEGLGRSEVTQFGVSSMQARRRTRITQIAAVLIYIPVEAPPEEPEASCLTAPPVISGNECEAPGAAPLDCPSRTVASSLNDTNSTRAVAPTAGLLNAGEQP